MPDVTFEDFTGGITDFPIDCAKNQAELMLNFQLSPNGRPEPRPGSSRDNPSPTAEKVITTPTRIGLLTSFENYMLKFCSRNVNYINNANTMTVLLGPSSNPVLGAADDFSELVASKWNKHVYCTSDNLGACKVSKIFEDSVGFLQVRTAGLPRYPVDGNGDADLTISSSSGAGSFSYGYAFVWRYEYIRSGNVTFINRSSPAFKSVTSNTAIGVSTITISGIQSFSNGGTDNYDTANIYLEIYRTTDGGSVYFLDQTIIMGTVSTTDTVTDTVLDDNEALYTTSGEVANDAPPACRYLHITESFAYYAYIEDNGETLSNTIRQSKQFNPDAVPGSFNAQIDDNILGISSVRSVPIVVGTKSVYRLDGFFANDGTGGITPQKISDEVGGINQNSIVQTIDWLYFAGTDGFYRTNGFIVQMISKSLSVTYPQIVQTSIQRSRIQGTFEPKENRVYWACSPTNNIDNDTIYIAHMEYFENEQTGAPFTTMSGQRVDNTYTVIEEAADEFSWTASALTFYRSNLWRAQRSGHTFVHQSTLFSDERPNPNDDTEWISQPIYQDYKGGIHSFGAAAQKKWVPRINGVFENVSNISCQCLVDSDRTNSYLPLPVIIVKDKKLWGESYWGDPTLWTDATRIPSWSRAMPPRSLRCVYKQIRLRSAFAPIVTSASRGAAILSAGTIGNTRLTLEDSGQIFVPDSIGYYVSIFHGGTWTEFSEILDQPNDTAVEFDANISYLDGQSFAWRIWGFFKGDTIKIQSFSLAVTPIGGVLTPYRGEANL